MRITFQASLFADLASIEATPANTLTALQALAEREIHVIPSTVTEINPTVPGGASRLRFASQDSSFEIFVGRNRLDIIERSPDPDQVVLIGIQEFAKKVSSSLDAIIGDRKINGTRLAFISTTMAPEYSKEVVNSAYSNLFQPPKYYIENTPFEWTFRSNARREIGCGDKVEPCNIILKIERTQGLIVSHGTHREFDRIMTEIDINTAQENLNPRFDRSDLSKFVLSASAIEEELCNSVQVRLEGK